MSVHYFVSEESVVRRIWGNGDTILLIFAGSAAEFALNKAVDWLYFTGKLPSDPLDRLFSTVEYARKIVFSTHDAALRTIDAMAAIHGQVEKARGSRIPDWAYRDVLFMLIDYSIRSFEVLERPFTGTEKQEVFAVFSRVGLRMGLKELPGSYDEWLTKREQHLVNDLLCSVHTMDLFRRYRKHIGWFRYRVLMEAQTLVVPDHVRKLLGFRSFSLLGPLIGMYKFSRSFGLDRLFKALLLPAKYKKNIQALDV